MSSASKQTNKEEVERRVFYLLCLFVMIAYVGDCANGERCVPSYQSISFIV